MKSKCWSLVQLPIAKESRAMSQKTCQLPMTQKQPDPYAPALDKRINSHSLPLLLVSVFMGIIGLFMTPETSAFQVYPSTGHYGVSLMLDTSKYATVAAMADGWWQMPWNWRNAYDSLQRKQLMDGFVSKKLIVEIEMGHYRDTLQGFKEPRQLQYALEAGAEVNTIMAYKEPGSLISLNELKWLKDRYGNRYKIAVSIRRWAEPQLEIIQMADALSFEFQVPAKFPYIWDDVVEAVKYCLEHKKPVYLLSPPGHNNYHLQYGYYHGYVELLQRLKNEIGEQNLQSPLLVFAPANYNIQKTQINMGPESEINTVFGVSDFLLRSKWHSSID